MPAIFRAVIGVHEIVSAQKVGRVAERAASPWRCNWPVIELAPVPGLPIFPVISARLMIDCAYAPPDGSD